MGKELDSRQRAELNELLQKTFASDKPGRMKLYENIIETSDAELIRLPFYRLPLYRLPLYRLPLYRLPLYRLPLYRLPLYRLPLYRLALYRLPLYRLPLYRFPLYRLPHVYRELVKKELVDMERGGIIEPTCSEWALPIVVDIKRDGELILCVDYRRLNSVTRVDAYLMPRELIEGLGKASLISTVDLTSVYWQIPVVEKDRCKTAIATPFGAFQFTVMLFGLSGAPASFQ